MGKIAERLIALGLAKKGIAPPADWQSRLTEQESRMRAVMPSSQEMAAEEAKKRTAELRRKAYILGYSIGF